MENAADGRSRFRHDERRSADQLDDGAGWNLDGTGGVASGRSRLLPAGLLGPEELSAALDAARARGLSLWSVLLDERGVAESSVAEAFSRWLEVPVLRLGTAGFEPRAVKSIPEELARKHECIPVAVEGRFLVLAMANPSDYAAVQAVEFHTGWMVRPAVATRTEVLEALDRQYAPEGRLQSILAHVADGGSDLSLTSPGAAADVDLDGMDARQAAQLAPVVRMCNLLIQDSVKAQASDIHIEPGGSDVQVRLRVDGVLRDYMQVPKWLHNALVSRLKILSDLDIAERRLPQDGRIRAQFQGRPLDLRVSTLPTQFGEKVVMRLLGSAQIPTFRVMGLADHDAPVLEAALNQPQGMILVTGPTGSGKTTSLYAMLTKRKSPEVNIVTVEDPIEYQLPGVSQVQINPKAGLTFPKCLRSILRQDPDVILVGEIRDLETAEIAFRAAMTGHLVLSTVHTNSTLATIVRLLDLGVDPVLITSAVHLIVAQRLARRVCTRCKEAYVPEPGVLERLRVHDPRARFFRGRGCNACGGTGHAGRIGLFEMMRMTPRMKELIQRRATEGELRKAATQAGTRFLLEDSLDKIRQGLTSPDEVLRVIQLDEDDLVRCPSCTSLIHLDFTTCPYCLHSLKDLCGGCGQELAPDWRVCPYCNAPSGRRPAAEPTALPHRTPATSPRTAAPPPRTASGPRRPTSAPPPPLFDLRDELGVAGAPGRPTGRWEVAADAPTYAAPAAPAPAARAPEPRAGAAARKARVLVVEPDDAVVRTVGAALRKLPLDVDVHAAATAAEAFALVEENLPDVVVLDVALPDVDGFTACERLRADPRTRTVPVMMLTSRSDDAERTRGYLVGADDYMQEPFSVEEFDARVLRLVRRVHGY